MLLIIHRYSKSTEKRNFMKTIPTLQSELIGILQTLYDTEALTPMMEFCQGEIRVLFYLLAHEGKVYPSQLSESLCVTRQRITTILSAMRKKELIRMEVEEQDRRRMSVTLTDLGRTAAIEKQQYAHRYLGQLVEALGEEDSRELVRLLERCTHIVHSVHETAKGAVAHV